MPKKKKASSKQRAQAEEEAPAKPPRELKEPTLMHITYHPEAGLLRANVQQDSELAGITQRHGRDVDIAIRDLDADIRGALEDAFKWVAEDVKAIPYEPEE